jgi:predicted RNase H-like HicB family nuclease/predicted transcriptional regulator
MTHSAHRLATVDELKKDYVLFVRPAKGFDDVDGETIAKTLRLTKELADIAYKHEPVNIGRTGANCTAQGEGYEEIMNKKKLNGFMSVFTDKEKFTTVLREFKEKDAGYSVVASGLTEDIFDVCKEIGLKPHTVLYSLGVWGKTEILPETDYLKITTLCGHSMVPPKTIRHCVEKIKNREMTIEEAAKKIAKPCPCGIFNPARTVEVLKKLTTV